MDNGAGGQLHSLIGGRSLGGRYQNNIKRVSILWLYLEHGSYGSTETVAFLVELLLISKVPCRLFRMKHNSGDLQELKGLLPCV